MKRLLTVLFLSGAITLLMAGCKGKDAVVNDPRAVITAFFDKMSKKDMDGAAKLCTKDSKSTIDLMKKAVEAADKFSDSSAVKDDGTDDFKDMVIGDATINGDNATVKVTNKKKDETIDFPLKKEGGDWKVDFSMTTLMKMGMDAKKNKGEDLFKDENTVDTTLLKDWDKMFNSDTLKEKLDDVKEELEKIKKESTDKIKEELKEN